MRRLQILFKFPYVYWGRQEHSWNEIYQRLFGYKKAYKDCDVPSEWKEGQLLGRCVN